MKYNMITTIVVAIVVAALGFFGGMKYQQSQSTNSLSQADQRGQGRQAGRNGGRGFGGATVGQIVSQDGSSITIKLQDGSSKIVNISSSTAVSKTDPASLSDLKTGTRVAAFGQTNSDGSVTAQTVQLNPMMRNGQSAGQPKFSQ